MPSENGAKVANEWQPMSALICVGPISRCVSLMAANTGRSGQPVQKFGGRGRNVADGGHDRGLVREHFFHVRRDRVGVDAGRMRLGQERRNPAQAAPPTYNRRCAAGSPCRARASAMSAPRRMTLICCSTYSGEPSSTTSTARFLCAELFHFVGHERIGDVEHIDRNARGAVEIGEIEPGERAQQGCWSGRRAR